MPRQYRRGHDPAAIDRRTEPPGSLRSDPSAASPPQALVLDRLADLVAEGQAELPPGLSPREQEPLEQLVRQRLRQRLVQYLARQIALDLHRRASLTE